MTLDVSVAHAGALKNPRRGVPDPRQTAIVTTGFKSEIREPM
jgi:hypothetical protein